MYSCRKEISEAVDIKLAEKKNCLHVKMAEETNLLTCSCFQGCSSEK